MSTSAAKWKLVKMGISAESDMCPDDRDMVKVELLNAFFASVSTAEVSLQGSQTLMVREEGWKNKDFLW